MPWGEAAEGTLSTDLLYNLNIQLQEEFYDDQRPHLGDEQDLPLPNEDVEVFEELEVQHFRRIYSSKV